MQTRRESQGKVEAWIDEQVAKNSRTENVARANVSASGLIETLPLATFPVFSDLLIDSVYFIAFCVAIL